MLDPSVDVMVSRDLDSRISSREQVVVVEWLEQSNLPFHIIRDHPGHFYSEWSSLVHGTILGYLKYFQRFLVVCGEQGWTPATEILSQL